MLKNIEGMGLWIWTSLLIVPHIIMYRTSSLFHTLDLRFKHVPNGIFGIGHKTTLYMYDANLFETKRDVIFYAPANKLIH